MPNRSDVIVASSWDARCSVQIYGFLQVHVGPHLQFGPQSQPVDWLFALSFWHPHLQDAPGHDSQLHGFELFNILRLLGFRSLACRQQLEFRIELPVRN